MNKQNNAHAEQHPKRLESLDILRGFDLFLLVFFQPVFMSLTQHWGHLPAIPFLRHQFTHADWIGFTAWDLVMPLFLFMVGAAMPFALDKHKQAENKGPIYTRIMRRFIILFILGMIIQGNLLSLNPIEFRIYTNTLQAIAVGYLVAAVFLLQLSIRNQRIATTILLTLYWALLSFHGNFTPEGNLAEIIDQWVLGRFRDGVSYDMAGNWSFNPFYQYAWVLPSLTFAVTTMLGVFAGQVIKNNSDKRRNSIHLLIWGIALTAGGYLLGFQMPIIKKIWSPSMTLFSGGICFLLMALFYYVIDYKGKIKHLKWLKVYGMNSITAYTLGMVISFRSIAQSLFWGTEKYIGIYYSTLIEFVNYLILFGILHLMYKSRIYIKI